MESTVTLLRPVTLQMKKLSEKPVFIYVLAILFLLAPVGNIALSLFAMGIPDWYQPGRILDFAAYVSSRDRIWLGLVFFAGLNLLRARKYSWILAMVSLAVVAVFNLATSLQAHGTRAFQSPFTLISLIATLSIFCIFFFFRYPYLDRRDGVLFYHRRVELNFPVMILLDQPVKAQILNLSLSGIYIACSDGLKPFTLKIGQEIQMEFKENIFKGKVLRCTPNGYGVHFLNLSYEQKTWIGKLVKVAKHTRS